MFRNSDEIIVCRCDEKTPLLWTFKFDYNEYWCPKCSHKSGMFGAGIRVPITPELEASLKEWEEKTKEFLSTDMPESEWKYTNHQ